MEPAERDAWRQADRILDRILDLPPGQRPAELAALASDPELHKRVRQLLAAHAETGGLLERPIPVALLPAVHNALTGRRLGRWRLLEEIGRGGMAVVYRAVADEGDAAGQLAALKILSIGTLASDGRDRFAHEQQALLRLRHPYLAQLYDTGVADDGTPWLAMALVEGERIDAWCEQRALGVEARVRLILQVCGALSYAHRNLVIHRDIKPSNVLVDHDGHVRLLDFGIARLTDNAAGERTTTALRALTPEYAAPEQFAGALPSTAMDVFGLGALLYRLLTGAVPRTGTHDGATVTQPSRRVLSAASLPEAERRLRCRRLRGDLDAVLLKSLAERPEARYDSVDALADDLKRWLDGLPVKAQPPSRGYRLRKFVARKRLAVAAGVLLLLSLSAGLGGTLWQADQARRQAALAQAAQVRTERALVRSDAIRDFLFELFRSTMPGAPRDQLPSTRELLADAVAGAPERFKDDPQTQAEFLSAIGEVYHERGMVEHLELRGRVLRLLAPHRQQQPLAYAAAQADLAHSLVGSDPDESSRLFGQAIATMERRAPVSRRLAYAYRQRAALQMHLQDGAARLRDTERAWRILEKLPDISARQRFIAVANVATGYHQAGKYQQALAHYDTATAISADAFDGVHALAVGNRANRAGVLSHLGRFIEAETEYRATLSDYRRVFDKPRDYMFANLRELELIQYRRGRFAEALQVRDEWDRLLGESVSRDPQAHAKSQVWRARVLVRLHRSEPALALLDAGLPQFTETGKRARNRLMGLSARIRLACDRSVATPPAGDIEQALALAAAMDGDKRVFAAEAHALAGLCALRAGDARQALAHLDRARALDIQLPPGDAAEAAEHLLWRGEALAALGDAPGARVAWDEARRRMRMPGLQGHPLNAALAAAVR